MKDRGLRSPISRGSTVNSSDSEAVDAASQYAGQCDAHTLPMRCVLITASRQVFPNYARQFRPRRIRRPSLGGHPSVALSAGGCLLFRFLLFLWLAVPCRCRRSGVVVATPCQGNVKVCDLDVKF